MSDLTAQVTSSLLPFPGVTVDALGEDEITLDSVLHGSFTVGRSGLAWLACGPHLEVVHAVTGERLSAYCFSGGGEHPPAVLAARDFSWLKRSGLLIGLEETEGSVLCLYDLGLSRVVKAVVIPGRITAIEPLVSYGGASTSTQHLHQGLRWFFGIAAVVTDLGHVLLVDLCLDDLSCSQSELEASDLQVVTKSPAEIPRLREVSTKQGRLLCLQLSAPSGVGATALQYIPRTNQLAVGFSDGNLQLWNMKTLKKEYHSQLEGGRVPVHAFTFQEPENDPRNCCYLWAVQSSQELEGDMVSLRLLQLAFSERKCLASGKILYEGLEYCEERYSQELSSSDFPLRPQATNTRLLSCQTIEKFRPHPDRDDSMNEVASPDTSVALFSWQVKAYGQGTPSTYIGVFDINRWYHAQMPDSLRMGESLQNCPYLAVWSLDPVVEMVSPNILLDVVVHERSLSRGLPFTCPPPEQYFNPTTYNYDATCLLNSGIVHLTCSGYQKETLSFLKKAAPCSSDIISTSYSRCLMSGLLSSRLADTQASSLSQEEQLDAILSTAVETSCLGLITGCIKQWTAEEQPGSALNLRYILDWAWNKVIQTKDELDGICAPLFDSSSNFTDPQTLQLLQHSQRLLSNLSTIFHCLLNEAQELTQKGLVGLMNKNMVSSLISKYAQVVLWFCRTGLLPEGSDDGALQISRPFYTHSVISNYYTIRREELTRLAKGKWCADCLMIDGLVGQCGEHLINLWKRDDGGTGQYPPPTLHALLDIYLLDNIDEAAKHAIVIYLLLDVMYSFPNKEGASVESFPTAFAIPIGLVKLVQGLWLLDHHDHQSSFELLLHPAASQCQFEWQHERVLHALMCQGQHSVALRYFHVTKPPISSTAQAKLCLAVLLHNRCLIEAWSLLRQHSNRLNMGELLSFMYESCQELGLMKEMLKLPLGLNEQECLEKFLQGTGGLQNRELLMVHYLQQANYIPALQLNQTLKMNLVNERDPKLKERSNTRNSILDQYGKVLPRVQRKLAMERTRPYQHPHAIHKEVSRPQPLSTITKRSANDKVMSRAGFINNLLTKIEEVWSGKGPTPQSSPSKSPRSADVQSPRSSSSMAFPDPFLGTPITMTSKRKSRILDLVACQTPQAVLTPPRPSSSWVSPKSSSSRAPELCLLQTPQVVKRARALAASVFSSFTPQSILRSSLRPTPVATPSASPGRSVTPPPPPRSKKGTITFIEEDEPEPEPEPEKGIRWTNGTAADSEISLLTRGSMLSKVKSMTWSSLPAEEDDEEEEEEEKEKPSSVKFLPPEGGIPSPELRSSESPSSSVGEEAAEESPELEPPQIQVNLSFDTVRSTDTTLEFYDAVMSEEQEVEEGTEEDVVTVNIRNHSEEEEPEEEPPAPVEETPLCTSEDPEREEEPSEDVMEVGLEQEEAQNQEVQSEKEDEQDVVDSSSQREDAAPLDQEVEMLNHNEVCDQVTESPESGIEVESLGQPDTTTGQDVQSEAVQSEAIQSEAMEEQKPESEPPTCDPEEELEQTTDLSAFVERHLFGLDESPLTRSGIHNASQSQASFNSESLSEAEEEEKEEQEQEEEEEEEEQADQPPAFSSQKSVASGTDSHSVVSVNDSEDLSSPASEEEEEEEEEDDDEEEEEESDQAEEEEEEEEEDSGSEVEIIEEVQGNGRLPALFVPQTHAHFLPALEEQEAPLEFSLLAPGTEIKMLQEDPEGGVVMVRLGSDDGGLLGAVVDEDEDQGASYMELKPSTTLLVPLELMDEGLVDGSRLVAETPGHGFSLMLDEDGGDREEDDDGELLPPVENDLEPDEPPAIMAAEEEEEAVDEFEAEPEVILLGADDEDLPLSEKASEEFQKEEEMDGLDGAEVDGPIESDLQTENTEGHEDAKEEEEEEEKSVGFVMSAEEPEGVSVLESSPAEDLPEVVEDTDSVAKENAAEEEEEEDEEEEEEEEEEEMEEEVEQPTAAAEPQTEKESEKPTSAEEEMGEEEVDQPTSTEDTYKPTPAEGELEEEQEQPTSAEEGEEKAVFAEEEMEEEVDRPITPVEEEVQATPAEEPCDPTPAEGESGEEKDEPLDVEPSSREEQEEKAICADEQMEEEVEQPTTPAEDTHEPAPPEGDLEEEQEEPMTPSDKKPEVPEENRPLVMDTEDVPGPETATVVVEDEQQDNSLPAGAEEGNTEEIKMVEESTIKTRGGQKKVKEEEEESVADISTMESPKKRRGRPRKVKEAESGEDAREEIKAVQDSAQKPRGRQRKVKDAEEEETSVLSSSSQPEERQSAEPEETPAPRRRKPALSTPTTRRTTRSRAVSFISPLAEETDETGEEEENRNDAPVPASPARTPRKSKSSKEDAKVRASTPRRITRKAQPLQPEMGEEEAEANDNYPPPASTSKASSSASPSRRQATRSSRGARSGSEEALSTATEDEQGEEVAEVKKVTRRTSSRALTTPVKRQAATASTPRRSSRKTVSIVSEAASNPLEVLSEEKEQEEPAASPFKHNSTQTEPAEKQPVHQEEEEEKETSRKAPSSPSRTTRGSNRNTLSVYPQVKLVPVSLPQSARKTTFSDHVQEMEAPAEPELSRSAAHSHSSSLRASRSKLWHHQEEDLPLLDSPLEVDSETPVADALIKRLQDEEDKQDGGAVVTKMVRASRKSSKSDAQSLHPAQGGEPEEDGFNPGEHSFIYSPSRRRTRANRGDSPGPTVELPTVTRSRRRAVKEASVAPHEEMASEEDNVEVEKGARAKTRKTGKQTAKSKALSAPVPVVEVDLMSPLPSPADPLPRAQRRVREREGEAPPPASGMNLRRKRIMDTVFTKPVTRRKKL